MSVYTIHEPPLRATGAPPDPERFAFVRDGFSGWAFVLAPLWMLLHRMWLVFAVYVVGAAGLETLVRMFGGSASAVALIGLLISLAIGLEAGSLRRFTLSRRGWKQIGVVSGRDREQAERRFFDAWASQVVTGSGMRSAAAPAGPGSSVPTSSMAHTDVIGLFPEPGAQR